MKRNSLLRIQQHLNNIGFLMVLISSTFCLSLGCGDAFFPSQIPILSPSQANGFVDFRENERHQIIKMDYHSVLDSFCLEVNEPKTAPDTAPNTDRIFAESKKTSRRFRLYTYKEGRIT